MGYTTNINWYSAAADADNDVADPFSGGTFTSQTNGWYHVCSFSRFRGTGNSNDNTVRVGGSIVAAYGSGITEDWLKTRKFKFVMSLVEEVIALKTLVGITTNLLSILSEMEILKSFMTVERINFDENKMPLT